MLFLVCFSGYFSKNCEIECLFLYYGWNCIEECNCDIEDCYYVNGCKLVLE